MLPPAPMPPNVVVGATIVGEKRRTNPVVDGQLVPKSGPRSGPMRKRRRDEPAAATPSLRARRR